MLSSGLLMKFDNRNNIVEVCLFESYLAKYFIETPDIFKSLINKILDAFEQIIQQNTDNHMFNRMVFSVFSTLAEDVPGLTNIQTLKESKSLIGFDTFCKYFTERVMSISSIKLPEIVLEQPISSLSALAQQSLFKSQKSGEAKSLAKMRPSQLFSDKNRGVIDIDVSEMNTRDHGILSDEYTPESLKNYFVTPHTPGYIYYEPKEDSSMAQWLRKHYLPVITGASGGIGKTISKINSFMALSKTEYQLLGLLIASSTIALGHHSFFEVIRPLSFFTGNLVEKANLLEFYEQIIPEEIRALTSYQSHIAKYGELIQEFVFDNPAIELQLSK